MRLQDSLQQTFGELVIHTPFATTRYDLPWTFSTFDYRTLCGAAGRAGRFQFETAKVERREGNTVITDRGELTAPLIVDALGWRRVLGPGANVQPPDALLSRGLEVHPLGFGRELEIWIDRDYVPAGYGWRFPADGELRIGVGSFDPRYHVREPTVRLAHDLNADTVRYQGNWIPHALRPATEDGIFFVGDSAGHCLPLTAEGIRTALYFGLACGRELRRVIAGQPDARAGARSLPRASRPGTRSPFRWLLRVPAAGPASRRRGRSRRALRAMSAKRFVDWSFNHYLEIAHPDFVFSDQARAASVWTLAPSRRRIGEATNEEEPCEAANREATTSLGVDRDRDRPGGRARARQQRRLCEAGACRERAHDHGCRARDHRHCAFRDSRGQMKLISRDGGKEYDFVFS